MLKHRNTHVVDDPSGHSQSCIAKVAHGCAVKSHCPVRVERAGPRLARSAQR